MPAKRIIVLERQRVADRIALRYALWADVPVARQAFYANPNALSAFRLATAQEIQDLRDGKVVERVENWSDETPLLTGTVGSARAAMIARWTAFQAEITAENVWSLYGANWDGTAWQAVGA